MGSLYEAELSTEPAGEGALSFVASGEPGGGTPAADPPAVVRFSGPDGWVGRFACGRGGLTTVARLWESEEFVVVSRGQAYVVDASTRELTRTFGGFLEWLLVIPHLDLMVFHNRLWVEGLFSSGLAWQTRRLAWDGLRNLAIDGDALVGEAHDPGADAWLRFSVDLSTGEAEGGSYPGPERGPASRAG